MMGYVEMMDIIDKDPDWLHVKRWKRKHFRTYYAYCRYCGLSWFKAMKSVLVIRFNRRKIKDDGVSES